MEEIKQAKIPVNDRNDDDDEDEMEEDLDERSKVGEVAESIRAKEIY